MEKFKKIVAIEPVSLVPWGEEELKEYAEEIIMYDDIPSDDDEIIKRVGDADALLVSYTSRINSYVIENCPNLRYIGMCCSLYSEESANVDIAFAREKNINVLGIRDYGDRGVVEFVLYELIKILHGFDGFPREDLPSEITNLNVGVVGLGTSGTMIAEAMQMMGANVSYYSRTRKTSKEEAGMVYMPLDDLLKKNDVIFTCLNKNVILLKEEEFKNMGKGKIVFNTSIGPGHDVEALAEWLDYGEGIFVCDTVGALGDEALLSKSNVICAKVSAGRTKQAFELLSRKVLDNIKTHLGI